MAGHKPLDQEICIEIIAQISKGCTIKTAVAEVCPDAPNQETVQRNFFAALAASQELAQAYARAGKSRAQAHFERIGDIAEQVLLGKLDPQAARVAIDAWKWTAGRMDPKKYGDRVVIEDDGKKNQLSREQILLQLRESGLRVSDVFQTLTKGTESAGGQVLEIEEAAADDSDDLSGLEP